MALNLTYMWIIVAKLAKLQKSIFSRGTPTATTTTTIIYHYSLIQYIAIYCNSIVATSPPPYLLQYLLVPPINTILLQYLLQYIAIQYIVPYLWLTYHLPPSRYLVLHSFSFSLVIRLSMSYCHICHSFFNLSPLPNPKFSLVCLPWRCLPCRRRGIYRSPSLNYLPYFQLPVVLKYYVRQTQYSIHDVAKIKSKIWNTSFIS